jgi:lysophospholipase L1-like esterase
MLTAILAIILALILVSGALFAYLNRYYIIAWYQKVSNDDVVVSPFLEQRVQAFTVTPAVTPDAETLVFVGDSLIETFPWDEHFGDRDNLSVINRGIYGDTIGGLAVRFDLSFLVERHPTIVLMIGANDIGTDTSCSEPLVESYRALLVRLADSGVPGDRVFVNGLLPTRRPDKSNAAIVTCNAAIEHLTTDLGLRYIDLYNTFADESGELNPDYSLEDGLHLNAEGYRVWLRIIKEHLAIEHDRDKR